jgi:pyrimidine-specific ribonucleoside hydrolase
VTQGTPEHLVPPDAADPADRDWAQLRQQWQGTVELGQRHPQTPLAAVANQLAAAPPPPESPIGPVIVDTDIGGDADDAIALAVAALRLPQLALVVTSDERGRQRARFARWFLDQLGRPEVPVVAGVDLGNTRYLCVQELIPHDVTVAAGDVVSAVETVCAATDAPVRWVGMGPMSNLAALLAARPQLANQLLVTQMGGALRYREPARAEHNVRLDPSAAIRVAQTPGLPLWLVTSDVTFTPHLEITAASPLYATLVAPHAPAWAHTLRAHLDRWFAGFHPGTIQHDALTLSAALHLPFVDFDTTTVAFDEIGRMREDPAGTAVALSYSARYPAFMTWLQRQLAPWSARVPTP